MTIDTAATAQRAGEALVETLHRQGPTTLDDSLDAVIRQTSCTRQEALYGLTYARQKNLIRDVPGTRSLVAASDTTTLGRHQLNLGHVPGAVQVFDPETSPLRYDDLRAYGEAVGRHHQIYASNGHADVWGLLERLGGRFERQGSDQVQLVIFGAGDFAINPLFVGSDRRQRLNVACTLGAYFTHYLQPGLRGGRVLRRRYSHRATVQANLFATGLLAPAAEFTTAWRDLDGDSWRVGDVFDVSPAFASTRAAALGLPARVPA